MFGESVFVELDAKGAQRKFARLRGRFANLKPVFEGPVLDLLREEIRQQFETEGAHFGEPWPELSKRALEWRADHGYAAGPILQASHELINSFLDPNSPMAEVEITPLGAALKSLVPWGAIHQVGGGKIPQREILPDQMPEEFMQKLRSLVGGYIVGVEFSNDQSEDL